MCSRDYAVHLPVEHPTQLCLARKCFLGFGYPNYCFTLWFDSPLWCFFFFPTLQLEYSCWNFLAIIETLGVWKELFQSIFSTVLIIYRLSYACLLLSDWVFFFWLLSEQTSSGTGIKILIFSNKSFSFFQLLFLQICQKRSGLFFISLTSPFSIAINFLYTVGHFCFSLGACAPLYFWCKSI